ncbi:MAG: sulfatase-like hydrolase/transferase [Planctomycetes bacterium]|nr:sulfatase-like hydrolase/transferase [Planctomycetota bacterium]
MPSARSISILTLSLLCSTCGGAAAERPNILLITLDTTRPDRLGCYGWEDAKTPNIDSISERGVRFEMALSTAGITPMAHASILTGLNPYNHGLRVFHGEVGHTLVDEVSTLPEALSLAGYETAGFVSAYPLSPYYGLSQGFETYRTGIEDTQDMLDLTKPVRSLRDSVLLDQPRSRYQRRADSTTAEAMEWLGDRSDDAPWFAWLHFFDVHDLSLVPPPDWASRFGVSYEEIPHQRDLVAKEAFYDMELAWMDHQLGALFEQLERSGELEDTIVVITADHGQGLSDGQRLHGWSRHRLIYQWSIQVPLLIAGPGMPRGAVVNALSRITDIAPTLLELADAPPLGPMDGASLLPMITGDEETPRIAYADALNLQDSHAPLSRLPEICRDDLHAVFDGRYKLIHHRGNPERSELFDLSVDPEEQVNLYGDRPEVAERLRAFLIQDDAFKLQAATAGGEGPDTSALEGLGYTGD